MDFPLRLRHIRQGGSEGLVAQYADGVGQGGASRRCGASLHREHMKHPALSCSRLVFPLLLAVAAAAMAGTPAADKKVVAPTEREDIVVHPITGPYWHEDSFVGNDARAIFAYHHLPGEILGGGRAMVYALQLRLRLLDQLQLVAYKDGYMDMELAGYNDEGWNDIGAGLKWAFLQNDALQLHSAIGVGYEFASGDDNVFHDDDELRFWWSINKGFGPLHLGAMVNYFLATDNGDDALGDSNHLSWHFHADYQVCPGFSPVVEFNGYHVLDEGDVVTPFSGSDVLNLGGNKNENTITVAVGAEVRPCRWFAVRGAYERAIVDDNDLFGHRWTFSAVFKF